MKEATIHNERGELTELTRQYPGATVVMEAGTHSPWVSRYLQELGMRVIVANPRKTRAIYENVRKSDRKDAMMVARLGRMDPELLYPIEHGSRQAQEDMVQIKLRDSLVRSRVALICAVRFILKSQGYRARRSRSLGRLDARVRCANMECDWPRMVPGGRRKGRWLPLPGNSRCCC